MPIWIGDGAGYAGTKFLKWTADFRLNIGNISTAELLPIVVLSVFEIYNEPGEEVVWSYDYIK